MRSPTRPDIVITVSFTFAILFSAVVSTPGLIGAQLQTAANVTNANKIGVKIISPSGNTTVPSGQLTINGISSDTLETNCRVYVDWNDLKPMENVTAKGLGGSGDYSDWTYTYTEKYHIIVPGTNELTSKITCFGSPSNTTSKYYSINITGLKNNVVSPSSSTLPSSNGNVSFGFHNTAYLPQYNGFDHNIFQPIVKVGSVSMDSSNDNSRKGNNDESKDDGDGDSDSTNNDSKNNVDSQSQTTSPSDDVKDEGDNGSKSTGSGNKHSNGGSQPEGNKEHRESHEKKHDNIDSKDKGNLKHKGVHPKNLKAHKQKH